MLRTLKELITGQAAAPLTSTPASRPPEIQVAAAALLVQLAHADGEFSPAERAQVEAALVRHFNLDPATIAEILSLAEHEQKQSIDDFRFTRVIREHFDVGQRMVLAEIMWGVALADGRVADQESHLFRKLGHLLDLQPGYLAEARRAAQPGPPHGT
ncbi:MAG: TerB family tellurite resistance protein [Gemmatimonadetes bacterium]|nr:TerB family tellurite resistance protein [Gemmatimonadota bacterium]